jgi:hypothetical protein
MAELRKVVIRIFGEDFTLHCAPDVADRLSIRSNEYRSKQRQLMEARQVVDEAYSWVGLGQVEVVDVLPPDRFIWAGDPV